jgi:hypothetical protein
MEAKPSRVLRVFGMNDDAWRRHANPWSVYTRFAAIPPLVLAIWSRAWLGVWCLVPIALVACWLWLNVRIFRAVDHPTAWASKGIYGERIWATHADKVPPHHRRALRLIALAGLGGIALLVWGLIALDVWPTVVGVTLVVLAQLWRIDRLVWMYDELQQPIR